MSGDIDISFDVARLEQANLEAERDLIAAGRDLVTANARVQLKHAVSEFPVRTGNLRSSATDPWRHLGLIGRPLTTTPPGIKEAAPYQDHGKTKYARVKSWGRHDDRRSDDVKPSYKYELYAAEWRRRPMSHNGVLDLMRNAFRDGFLSRAEFFSMTADLKSASYDAVFRRIAALLAVRDPAKLIPLDGYWKFYGNYAGNRRKVTGQLHFKFTNEYRKALEKHSGRNI